ncbi:MAG: hypothetical protein ACRDDZ_07910 [Marinifilaceae bacterium]
MTQREKLLSMEGAIDYKEWLKMYRFIALGALLMTGMTVYALLRMERVVQFKGAGHLWDIMLTKDVVFIESLTYIPVFIGVVLAIAQFVPEMEQKRMKLTLHLPYPAEKMMRRMVWFGFRVTAGICAASVLLMAVRFYWLLAPEFMSHVLLTATPWFMAGCCAYLLTVWVVVEPTRRGRLLNALCALLWVSLFFVPAKPEAGNGMIGWYALLTVVAGMVVYRSMYRFKEGKQD